ncbi:MAG: hypothetical protein ABR613_11130 [Actinomycetota bacterium]
MAPRQILIVANQTAIGDHLKRLVRERMEAGPCAFTLLVPASAPHGTLTYTDEEVVEGARERLRQALEALREIGADIEGHVEVASPAEAVEALMQIETFAHHDKFDEILVSTFPPGVSRWLKQDLPHRLERRYGIPVTHVIGDAP